MLDADIRDFFGQLDRAWLRRFLEHRIADRRVLRLIDKWLGAGVVEDGHGRRSEAGAPQGASVSPLLANVYLHYVFDLWAARWRRPTRAATSIVVRFADDFVVGFQHRDDAERFLAELRERFAKFGLELHPDKTRLIEFGRFAARTRGRGGGQAGDVRLPGLHAHLREDQERAVLAPAQHDRQTDAGQAEQVKDELQAAPASPDPGAGAVAGQRAARPLRLLRRARQQRRISAFRYQVIRHWLRALRRRSQRTG